MDAVKQRLLQYAKKQNIAMMEFYKKTSISQSNFSGTGADSALSTDKIIHILITFSDLNPDWLLLEKGKMLRSDNRDNAIFSSEKEESYKNILIEKNKTIEALIRENEQLRIENENLKSPGTAGIIVQHDGGNNTYNNNANLMHLVASQQSTIKELTEQNRKLTDIIASKL